MCELPDRDLTRTGYKCSIMVKPLTGPKKEPTDDDMGTATIEVDYGTPDDEQQQPPPQGNDKGDKGVDSWRLPGWEAAEVLRDSVKKSGVHPVDPIAIACKSDPIPLKDLDDKWLRMRTDGWYGGYPIHETLLKE